MANEFSKDPAAVLDYTFDWAALTNGTGKSDWLASGETISSYTVTADAGITKNSDTNTSTTVTVWLSGGTIATRYKIVCQIVTNFSRTDERTITIAIENR